MTDREKVINQIDVDIQRAERTGEMLVHVGRKTAKAALALLKEQEAIKPKIDAFGHPYCPKCKILVYETWKFCPHCGQEVKWE